MYFVGIECFEPLFILLQYQQNEGGRLLRSLRIDAKNGAMSKKGRPNVMFL